MQRSWRPDAATNGAFVLTLLHLQTRSAEQRVRSYVGKDAFFFGSCVPPGGTPDLITEHGVLLKIDIKPYRNVLPHAAMWTAFVCGVIKRIDYGRKTIWLEARPEYWNAFDTF